MNFNLFYYYLQILRIVDFAAPLPCLSLRKRKEIFFLYKLRDGFSQLYLCLPLEMYPVRKFLERKLSRIKTGNLRFLAEFRQSLIQFSVHCGKGLIGFIPSKIQSRRTNIKNARSNKRNSFL